MTDKTPIRVFLSYAHADDKNFSFVQPIKEGIQAFVKAKSGRDVNLFIDKESIGWGENWRERISEELQSALVFMPLLSASYLESEHCRDEFLTFYSQSSVLGVTNLVLPILLFQSSLFEPGTDDEIAKIAESLQYRLIEEPILDGYDSPAWRRTARDLAQALLSAVDKAEDLLNSPDSSKESGDYSTIEVDNSSFPGEGDSAGLIELLVNLESLISNMNDIANDLSPKIESWSAAPQSVKEPHGDVSTKKRQLWLIQIAQAFKQPSLDILSDGEALLRDVNEFGNILSEIRRIAHQVEDDELQTSITSNLNQLIAAFGDLSPAMDSMDLLLSRMKSLELLSVPLRKALQPARQGITAIRDSIKLVNSWKSFGLEI